MKKCLLLLLSLLCCLLLLTACDGEGQEGTSTGTPDVEDAETPEENGQPNGGEQPPSPHQHTYASELTFDETHHWHAATCGCEGDRAKLTAHRWQTTVEEASCTENGSQRTACADCGYLQSEELLPAAHTKVMHAGQAPTCAEEGWEEYVTCERCDYTTYQAIPPRHTLAFVPAKEPTCTEDGWYKHESCSVCGYIDVDPTIKALDHDKIPHEGKPATEEAAGWKPYETCSRCDYTTYEEIPMLEHVHIPVQHEAKAATCTVPGWEAYETCESCSYTTYRELPTLPHETESHAKKPATCTAPGWEAYENCKNCSYTTYRAIPASGHTDGDWITDEAATCTEAGSRHRGCSVCGKTVGTEAIPATGHRFAEAWSYTGEQHYRLCLNNCHEKADLGSHELDTTGLCACGYQGEMPGLYTVREDGTILFGYYPQSDVTDAALIAALNMQAGSLPSVGNNEAWTLHEYETALWYIDLTHNGRRYRGVYYSEYRDDYPNYQESSGHLKKTVYWFRYDVLEWQVLKQESGKALLLCTSIIDAQGFQAGPTKYIANGKYGGYSIITSDTGYGKYISNYYYSTIRTWLNATFYETAFTAAQQAIILTTTVDNSAASLYAGATPSSPDATNASSNTQDKIFLLSKKEICQYGFAYYNGTADPKRMRKPSEYAKAMGCPYYKTAGSDLFGYGSWWLRSPNYSPAMSSYVNYVSVDGMATECQSAGAFMGVVPALYIDLTQSS